MTLSQQKEQKFWDRVQLMPSGCWEWQGARDKDGYGKAGHRGRAHRLAWELCFGPLPPGSTARDGTLVRHTCNNPPCCNPAHLERGTHRDNMLDMRRAGSRKGERHGRAKLNEKDVRLIRARHAAGESYSVIARDYTVHPSQIAFVCNGRSWAHVR